MTTVSIEYGMVVKSPQISAPSCMPGAHLQPPGAQDSTRVVAASIHGHGGLSCRVNKGDRGNINQSGIFVLCS